MIARRLTNRIINDVPCIRAIFIGNVPLCYKAIQQKEPTLSEPTFSFTCPNCNIGKLKQRKTTLVRVYDATLISIPNALAWECDVCHTRQYDPALIGAVELLITPSGPPPNHYEPPSATAAASNVKKPRTRKPSKPQNDPAVTLEAAKPKPRSKG
jgi:YgiT-type zinc finger domain-containing protein